MEAASFLPSATPRDPLNDRRVQISLRFFKRGLWRLKARKLKGGMPYQTLINSILRKAVS
jgi:predicted DNA binding CopG/RHH family protein